MEDLACLCLTRAAFDFNRDCIMYLRYSSAAGELNTIRLPRDYSWFLWVSDTLWLTLEDLSNRNLMFKVVCSSV